MGKNAIIDSLKKFEVLFIEKLDIMAWCWGDPMEKIRSYIKDRTVELVRVELEDLNGLSRGLILEAEYFLKKVEEGVPLCTSILSLTADGELVKNTDIPEENNEYPNGFLYPDVETFKILPWLKNSASVLVDFRLNSNDKSSPVFPISPRVVCKKQIKKLEEMGFEFYGAFEFEYYLLNQTTKKAINDNAAFCVTSENSKFEGMVSDLMQNLRKIGIRSETFHTELSPGQQELTLAPTFGISCADTAFRFRHLVKEIAGKHGYLATFLSKPFLSAMGSSGHFNHSIWSMDRTKNLFSNLESTNKLSELAEQWLAGLICHSKSLIALACPTPNCFQRLTPGSFLPCNHAWGYDNRTVTYRVKNYSASQTYIENRMPGAAVNPYLIMAGTIMAGMDGIRRKLKLPFGPCAGNNEIGDSKTEQLPQSLNDALDHFREDELFNREFGEDFIKYFITLKKREILISKEFEQDKDLGAQYRERYSELI